MTEPIRKNYSTNTVWEEIAGFSRAIRVSNRIIVAGTTATGPEGIIGKGDPTKQMHFILDRIEQSIIALGGKFEDIIITRTYVSDINHWETVARIHGEKFKNIRPVNTLIEAGLVGDCLVEVEAEAFITT
ncbi:MAG: RidA family protein [Neisseriaceae bacterium]